MNNPPPGPAKNRHSCMHSGCHSEATCMPRLYVPAHPLSRNRNAEDVSALMGLPLCDHHFTGLKAKDFLRPEVRDQISAEFRKVSAVPDFDKAVIGRVSRLDHDFGRYEVMKERARSN